MATNNDDFDFGVLDQMDKLRQSLKVRFAKQSELVISSQEYAAGSELGASSKPGGEEFNQTRLQPVRAYYGGVRSGAK